MGGLYLKTKGERSKISRSRLKKETKIRRKNEINNEAITIKEGAAEKIERRMPEMQKINLTWTKSHLKSSNDMHLTIRKMQVLLRIFPVLPHVLTL